MTNEETAQIKQEWTMAIINLALMGKAQGFLDETGSFDFCVSTDTDKISAQIKVEPTNIIKFPKQ
jgi:hypothetical protein